MIFFYEWRENSNSKETIHYFQSYLSIHLFHLPWSSLDSFHFIKVKKKKKYYITLLLEDLIYIFLLCSFSPSYFKLLKNPLYFTNNNFSIRIHPCFFSFYAQKTGGGGGGHREKDASWNH